MSENVRELLDAMLGFLDFNCQIQETLNEDGSISLQIYTPERDRLIGRNGETLEDIQFLINRLLQAKDKEAPRVHVDVEHYRQICEDNLLNKVRQIAELVRKSGRSYCLEPMNAYDRRLVHNAFKDDPEVMTWSPADDARLKRITLKRRNPEPQA